MSRKKAGPKKGNITETAHDKDQMLIEYLNPTCTLQDLADKYNLSLGTIYFFSNKYKWTEKKKQINEQALCDAVGQYTKKRKKALVRDLEKISGIEDSLFKRIQTILRRKDGLMEIRIGDLVKLIKLKYELIANFSTNKQIVNNNVQEGDTNFNFNITDNELDVKIVNLVSDMRNNKTISNRMKALKEGKKK